MDLRLLNHAGNKHGDVRERMKGMHIIDGEKEEEIASWGILEGGESEDENLRTGTAAEAAFLGSDSTHY